MGLSYFVSSLTLLRNYSGLRCMPPAAASEEKRIGWGHPRPRQETAPPAPPLQSACGGERRKKDWLGTPQTPAGGSASCTSDLISFLLQTWLRRSRCRR